MDPVYYGPLISTDDDGQTWKTIIPSHLSFDNSLEDYTNMSAYVSGNRDNLVFACDLDKDENMFLHHSTDNGKNWSSYLIDTLSHTKTIGLYCFPHTNEILRTYTTNMELHGTPDDDGYEKGGANFAPTIRAHDEAP